MPAHRWWSLLPALLALSAGAACEDEEPSFVCGPGTRAEAGACVADCGEGTELDPASGSCVQTCVPGTHRDPSGGCLPDYARCVSGEVWDVASSRCVDVAGFCAEGTVWLASRAACVPRSELVVPDQTEGDAENDGWWELGAGEHFQLPEIGAGWTLGGTFSVPSSENGRSAEVDRDWWLFEVVEPTLLRVTADAYGGASAGFVVESEDRGSWILRYGIGSSGSQISRDLFLPRAGLYAVVAADAMNLIRTSGPWFSKPDTGYAIRVERLPLPEPQRLTVDDSGRASAQGFWPFVPPADGSALGFYTVAADPLELVKISVQSSDREVFPVLDGVWADGSSFETDLSAEWPSLSETGGDLMLVVDYRQHFANEGAAYRIDVAPGSYTKVEDALGPTVIHQEAWSFGSRAPQPLSYFAFNAEKDQVVTLHLENSSGFTCIKIENPTFTRWLTVANCMLADPESHRAEVRFAAPYTGLYMMQVLDWGGANTEGSGGLVSIPAHDFTYWFDIHRQAPPDLGRMQAQFAASETLTAEEWQRFYWIDPEPGDTYWIEAMGQDGLDPFWVSYLTYASDDFAIDLAPDWYTDVDSFPFRSVDGKRLLLGVSDGYLGAGRLDVRIEPIQFVDLGELPPGSEIEPSTVLAQGRSRVFLQIFFPEPGLLDLEITPPEGVDIAVMARDQELGAVMPWALNERGPGEPETLVRGLRHEPIFFEVTTADGQPLAADATLRVHARLQPLTAEREQNGSPEDAMVLTLPENVGALPVGEDPSDWYSFTLAAPALVDAVTMPYGVRGVLGTNLYLLDAAGTLIASDEALWNGGAYAGLRAVSLEAGTYYLRAEWLSTYDDGYLLSVAESAPAR